MSKPLVLYHDQCPDGFCAAWVANKFFGGGNADFLPVQYNQDPPDCLCREVYILDFSYKRPEMRKILSQAIKVVVLDHHKTAQAELDGLCDEVCMRPHLISNQPGSELPFIHFDMQKSGGRLTWEHFFPHAKSPWLVDYTEDRDLWLWKLDWSKEISAYLGSLPRNFGTWNNLEYPGPGSEKWDTYVDAGRAILRYQAQLVEAICGTAREVVICGYSVLAANSSVLFSEVAEKLAEDRPFGACWFIRGDGKKQWSLRSRAGGIDVSDVARFMGGGGHPQAAWFEENV